MEVDAPGMALRMDSEPAADVCMSDRLIPSRGGTCGGLGHMKMQGDENWAPQNEFQEVLSQNVFGKDSSLVGSKVLSYRHRPQKAEPVQNELKVLYSSNRDGAPRPKATRVIPQSALKVLDAPGLLDDFYSHPIDWSARNVVAVALAEMVYLFDAASGKADQLTTLQEGATATALRWTKEGFHLGVGTSTGECQIWDGAVQKQVRSLRGHTGRIGAVAWHDHVLTSGAADAEIHHHDVRIKDHLVGRLVGAHTELVCGLDYSSDGMLASGGNDNIACIWENVAARAPLRTLTEHNAAVKALRWCPWQRHVLATGGGSACRKVCLWNASSGRLLMSADAESQVTGIAWGQQEKELLTAHGYTRNQLTLWKYPSLVKSQELEGHTGRLLGLTQSPDGAVVCSASADETLRFWKVFSATSNDKGGSVQFANNPLLKTIR